MKLHPDESELRGAWRGVGERVEADAVTRRIEGLVQRYLVRVTSDVSGWDVLYRDPEDGRLWELTYPHSDAEGGGPPHLVRLDYSAARLKYGDTVDEG